MSEPVRARSSAWAWKAGWFLFVVATSVLTWGIARDVQPALIVFSFAACSQLFSDMWSTFRLHPAWDPRSFRFSIAQLMVVAGLAAVYLGILRAWWTAYPIEDNGIVLMLSGAGFLFYALFCFSTYQIWAGVRNIRAVLRGERIRHGNLEHRSSGKRGEEGDGP